MLPGGGAVVDGPVKDGEVVVEVMFITLALSTIGVVVLLVIGPALVDGKIISALPMAGCAIGVVLLLLCKALSGAAVVDGKFISALPMVGGPVGMSEPGF
jgi:hypothetical protein